MRIHTYLLMQMIITALMCLELVDAAIALIAQIAEERFASFAGGFGLFRFCSYVLVGCGLRGRLLSKMKLDLENVGGKEGGGRL